MAKKKVVSPIDQFIHSLSPGLIFAVCLSLAAIVVVNKLLQPGRYVSEFTQIKRDYPVGRTEAVTPQEKQIIATINQIGEKVKTQPWFALAHEHVFVTITDLNNLPLTIDVAGGNYQVRVGWFEPEKKTLELPVETFHINRLAQIVADGQITQSELFEMASVGLVPILDSLYQADALYFPGDKRILKMDNFLQVEVKNTYGLKDRMGNPLEAKATVVNVDGQWLVFPGHVGNPDIKYVVTVDQMLEYYYLLQYKFNQVKTGDLLKRKELLDEYFQLRNATAVAVTHST